MERQIMEALKIAETPPETLMNSKSEWGNNSVPRVVVQQERDTENNRDKGGIKRTVQNRDGDPGDRTKRRRQNSTQSSTWSREVSKNQNLTFQSIASYFNSNSSDRPSVS